MRYSVLIMCYGVFMATIAVIYTVMSHEYNKIDRIHQKYVTRPEKTGLIYTKYTHPYYGIYLFLCVCYLNSVSFIEILRIFCIYDEMFVEIVC